MNRLFSRALSAIAFAATFAACSPPPDGGNAAKFEALRAPDRVQKKTAEVLAPNAPATVTVSDIHLEKKGKGLGVVWTAKSPAGEFLCNADKRVDFPVCEPKK